MMTVLVDKMIKMKILEPAIVQAWIFSEEMKVEFKRFVSPHSYNTIFMFVENIFQVMGLGCSQLRSQSNDYPIG